MQFIVWLALYLAAFLLEGAVLPVFFGARVPALSLTVLLIGVAFQDFWAGFWFASFAGLLRDVLASAAFPYTVFALLLFGCLQLFLTFVQWDDPLRRLGAILIGLLAAPPVWLASSAVGHLFFHLPLRAITLSDLTSRFAFGEAAFAASWFLVFSWCALRVARRKRSLAAERI